METIQETAADLYAADDVAKKKAKASSKDNAEKAPKIKGGAAI